MGEERVVRRYGDNDSARKTIVLNELDGRDDVDPAVIDSIRENRDAIDAHLRFMIGFSNRLKLGSSLSDHTEQVIEWLIEQGWTPPPDGPIRFLPEAEENDV